MSQFCFQCDKCHGTFEFLVRNRPGTCPETREALTYLDEYKLLFGPAPTGCLHDPANKAKAKAAQETFKQQVFLKRDHVTSFLLGRFDVAYYPMRSVVEITVRMRATFSNDNLAWTEQEIASFKRDGHLSVASTWNHGAKFLAKRPGWEPIVVRPEFDLEFVNDSPHIDAKIFKVSQPKANLNWYDVSKNLLQGFPEHPYALQRAMLTDLAPKFVKKTPDGDPRHNILAHEFGHMLGLPDEYDDETKPGMARTRQIGNVRLQAESGAPPVAEGYGHHTDSLMSDGTVMHPRFFVTVWEALRSLTTEYVHPEEWKLARP